MSISATQIRKGMIIKIDGELYKVHDFQHVTPGKGQAVMQTRLRNLRTGTLVEQRFRSAASVERVHLNPREVEYLYEDGNHWVFMDTETYEQIRLGRGALEDALPFLLPNTQLRVEFFEGEPITVELPGQVELEVTDTEPALKGATASASTKPATLETGLVVQVPPFIEIGDKVRVDTDSGEYVERV